MKVKVRPYNFLLLFWCLLFTSLLLNIVLLYKNYQNSIVSRVVDGDSLELNDGRRIRLLGLDTPETGRCMYEQAKNRLTYLAKGYHVRLKDTVSDGYGRTLANVIIDETFDRWMNYLYHRFILRDEFLPTAFVNRVLVEEGLALYTSQPSEYSAILKTSYNKAKLEKRGIFSSKCLQEKPEFPNCIIKGNIRNGKKTYFYPQCGNYNQVDINTAFGDAWFCTIIDAEKAGFYQSYTCP
jgi:endonuclease YncB( thermonuclease family)